MGIAEAVGGQDAAIARRETEIQRLERLVWDAVYALQKAGLDKESARLGGAASQHWQSTGGCIVDRGRSRAEASSLGLPTDWLNASHRPAASRYAGCWDSLCCCRNGRPVAAGAAAATAVVCLS
jgi:hypothetical protein